MASDDNGLRGIEYWLERIAMQLMEIRKHGLALHGAVTPLQAGEVKPRPSGLIKQRKRAVEIMLARLASAEDGLSHAQLCKLVADSGLVAESRSMKTRRRSSLTIAVEAGAIVKGRVGTSVLRGGFEHRYFTREHYLRFFAQLPDELQKQLVDEALDKQLPNDTESTGG